MSDHFQDIGFRHDRIVKPRSIHEDDPPSIEFERRRVGNVFGARHEIITNREVRSADEVDKLWGFKLSIQVSISLR